MPHICICEAETKVNSVESERLKWGKKEASGKLTVSNVVETAISK